jgi:hypothetical protein
MVKDSQGHLHAGRDDVGPQTEKYHVKVDCRRINTPRSPTHTNTTRAGVLFIVSMAVDMHFAGIGAKVQKGVGHAGGSTNE